VHREGQGGGQRRGTTLTADFPRDFRGQGKPEKRAAGSEEAEETKRGRGREGERGGGGREEEKDSGKEVPRARVYARGRFGSDRRVRRPVPDLEVHRGPVNE